MHVCNFITLQDHRIFSLEPQFAELNLRQVENLLHSLFFIFYFDGGVLSLIFLSWSFKYMEVKGLLVLAKLAETIRAPPKKNKIRHLF